MAVNSQFPFLYFSVQFTFVLYIKKRKCTRLPEKTESMKEGRMEGISGWGGRREEGGEHEGTE